MTGADASIDRALLDTQTNCIIIPESSPIQADGLLVSWHMFARQPGVVALDVSSAVTGIATVRPGDQLKILCMEAH